MNVLNVDIAGNGNLFFYRYCLVHSFTWIHKSYNNTKYELKNEPYKLIINDDNMLKNDNFEITLKKSDNNKIIKVNNQVISQLQITRK